jgi:mono/diheme cytochrome c family protein
MLFLTTACGGAVVAPVAETVVGTVPGQTTETVPPGYSNGDPVAGKTLFKAKGCNACHTLKDSGATGTVGPDLDQSKPSLGRAIDRVLNGKGAMPPFKDQLSTKQIADVAAYVVKASRQG